MDCYHCRELLQESDFHKALQRITEESIPFFSQFSTNPTKFYSTNNGSDLQSDYQVQEKMKDFNANQQVNEDSHVADIPSDYTIKEPPLIR